MSVLIDGNVITWTGSDVTPVILKCEVKKIGVNNSAIITPSPHINPNYMSDCTKILTGGDNK